MEAPPINQDQMQQLLEWIDGISFSRPKRNLARDFSDGVLVAQILRQYHPRLVQLHNYPSASALNAKFNNWKTLNEKVFRKLRFGICTSDIQSVITVVPGAIERVLFLIYCQLRRNEREKGLGSTQQITEQRTNSTRVDDGEGLELAGQLAEREDAIRELRSTIEMLQTKMRKMEELNRLKDVKIESLIRKLEEGIN